MTPPTGPAHPTHRLHRIRLFAAALVLPLSLVLIAGCGADRLQGGASGGGVPGVGAPKDQGSSAADEAVAGGGLPENLPPDGDAPANAPPGGATLTEQIVRTGDISVEVDEIPSAANRLTALVSAAGGSIGSDQRYGPLAGDGTNGSADLMVRVPPDRFEDLLETISELGEELSRAVAADDVSTVVADVDARVASLQNSVNRLLALAAQAVSVSDLIAIETELSARQSELESLQAQQRALADQVSLATLSVRLTAASQPEPEETGFLASLNNGWNALLFAGRGLVSIIGLLLPWLVLLALIAIPLWFLIRRRRSSAAPAMADVGMPAAGAAPPIGETPSVPAANEPARPPE